MFTTVKSRLASSLTFAYEECRSRQSIMVISSPNTVLADFQVISILNTIYGKFKK